ncbi:MAG: outer membrane beta-barrel protein [Verrucomicrobiota bacterium]|nr:outer membrane beta-barrel protein [Verrucomicrobiota bacterium]
MKNKILAMLVAFGLVGSVSAIEINENLSINGFIDGSITKTDSETAGNDAANWGLDEIEVDFLFNVGSVSGEVHVDTNNGAGTGDLDIEQAHFTYSLENGVSLTLGRYGSNLGFEREDPAGLYTYSRAYGGTAFDLGNVDASAAEGLVVSYAAEAWSLAVSIDNANGTVRTAGASKDDLDFEVALSFTGIENLSVGVGHRKQNLATAANEVDVTNVHAAYSVGKALVAAEYTELSGSAVDLAAHMFLVDYDVSDKLGVAVRYSTWETSATADDSMITIAPNYAITESLGAILEYSDVSSDTAGADSDTIALELTYTF